MSTGHKYEGPGAANTKALTNNQSSEQILCVGPDSGNKSVCSLVKSVVIDAGSLAVCVAALGAGLGSAA